MFRLVCAVVVNIQQNMFSHNMAHTIYYISINDTMFELSAFWPSDTESRINKLRFSDSVSLSFKTRLMSVTCFCCDVA